jgi:hypothetical protein
VKHLVSLAVLAAYVYGSACLWVWGHPVWMVVGFFFPPIPLMAAAVNFVPQVCK